MSACELRYHNINMVIKRNTRVIKGEIMKIDSTMDIFWFTQRGEGSFDCKVFFIETVWIEGDSTWSHKGRYHDDTHRNWILRHLMKFWVVWARSVFHGVDKKWMRSVWLLHSSSWIPFVTFGRSVRRDGWAFVSALFVSDRWTTSIMLKLSIIRMKVLDGHYCAASSPYFKFVSFKYKHSVETKPSSPWCLKKTKVWVKIWIYKYC